MKLAIIIAVFAMFALANSYTILPGYYNLIDNTTCPTPIKTLVFYSKGWFAQNLKTGQQYIYSQIISSDGVHLSGGGYISINGTRTGSSVTTTGEILSPYSFQIDYPNTSIRGAYSQFYNFISCSTSEENEF